MIDVLDLKLDNETGSIQKVPGVYVLTDVRGTVEVDGEQWNGRLLFFASPLGNLKIDKMIEVLHDRLPTLRPVRPLYPVEHQAWLNITG